MWLSSERDISVTSDARFCDSLTVDREDILECETEFVDDEVYEDRLLCESENLCLGDFGLADLGSSVGESL